MSDFLHTTNLAPKTFGAPAVTDAETEFNPPMGEGEENFAPTGSGVSAVTIPNFRNNRQPAPQVQSCAPGFTLVEGDCKIFAKEYAPKMECPNYIGDTDMLLKYLFREERRNRITMPIRTCGIDPIVFDNVEHLDSDEGQAPTKYFAIQDDSEPAGEDDSGHVYELIEVDNNLYLSCMSECLDPEYLHRIITEATTTMRETGSYTFRMVGLRRLAVSGDASAGSGRLLETLRLNTYEMSALCTYMSDFGVEPSFEIIDGHQCICFRAR